MSAPCQYLLCPFLSCTAFLFADLAAHADWGRSGKTNVVALLPFVSNGQRQGEIGWALGVEHRGSGYATEAVRGLLTFAFESCGYHRLFAGTILTNERSWKLMERVAMRKEAHFREAHVPIHPDGPWIDSVRYAILASEWATNHAPWR